MRVRAIIKADDLAETKGWLAFINIMTRHEQPAAIGLMGKTIRRLSPQMKNLVLELHNGGWECFNHGHAHDMDEFTKKSRDEQYKRLVLTNEKAKKYIGIKLQTFAPPGNNLNRDTINALRTIGEIKVVLSNSELFKNESQLVIPFSKCQIEAPTHTPNASHFKKTFKDEELLLLQVHPWGWTVKLLKQFQACLDLMLDRGVELTTPIACYKRRKNDPLDK